MNNNWLGRSNSALLALALIGVWKFAGYYMQMCIRDRPHPSTTIPILSTSYMPSS